MRRVLFALGALALAACEENVPPPAVATAPTTTPAPVETAAADPLGQKPTLAPPASFTPPPPAVFKTSNGITVWLMERHALPIVSATLSIPYGGRIPDFTGTLYRLVPRQ